MQILCKPRHALEALIGFAVATAYLPGLAITPRWIALCLVPLLLFGRPVPVRTPHLAGLAFLAIAALSLAWATSIYDGLDGMAKLLIIAGCFMLGSVEDGDHPALTGFAAGIAVSAVIAILQLWGFDWIDQAAAPAGTFGNRNLMGEAAAICLIAVIGPQRWRIGLAAGCLLALALSDCRGAWFAAGAGALAWYASRTRLWRSTIEYAVMLPGAVLLISQHKMPDLGVRLGLWLDTICGFTWSGNGIGSFVSAFPLAATHIDTIAWTPEAAHADILQIVFELGPLGLVAVSALVWQCWRYGTHWHRAVLAAFVADGLLGTPFYSPAAVFLGAYVAGNAARRAPRLRDVLGRVRAAAGARPRLVQ
jgi:hypothetical protein